MDKFELLKGALERMDKIAHHRPDDVVVFFDTNFDTWKDPDAEDQEKPGVQGATIITLVVALPPRQAIPDHYVMINEDADTKRMQAIRDSLYPVTETAEEE